MNYVKSSVKKFSTVLVVGLGLVFNSGFGMNTLDHLSKKAWSNVDIATAPLDRIIQLPWTYFSKFSGQRKLEIVKAISVKFARDCKREIRNATSSSDEARNMQATPDVFSVMLKQNKPRATIRDFALVESIACGIKSSYIAKIDAYLRACAVDDFFLGRARDFMLQEIEKEDVAAEELSGDELFDQV